MVLRITELRKEYGIQSFETEADRLAYEKEREENYNKRVSEKVAELKALYNANPTKYAKFSKFEESDWIEYAKESLLKINATRTKTFFAGLASVENDPEIAKWAKFTYEEIIQMEANGVLIPKEVLAWAHSMQDSDETAYEINDDAASVEETEQTGENSGNSELAEMEKKTLTLSNKSENTEKEVAQKFVEFEESAKKAEQIKRELETSKRDSLKKIEEMTQEWETLSAKVKKGSKLSESEQKRFKELGSMLNGEDGEMVTNIQASSDELQSLMDSMDGLNTDIEDSIELGDDTVYMAKQLAMYEKGYKPKNVDKANTVNMSFGIIKDLLIGAKGNDIAQNALKNGNSLIEFSNTLSTQLMMNQYASLYEFAQSFTEVSTETINNTKEVLGDDFNKTTEELNEQVDALPDMTNAENERYNLQQKGVGLIGQAIYFTIKSGQEIFNSATSMIELEHIEKEVEKERVTSQMITDIIVDRMSDKKERLDELTEKEEKAEAQKEAADASLEEINNAKDVESITRAAENVETFEGNTEEEFTEEDKQELDNLNTFLTAIGERAQQKLFQSLSKVDNLQQLLATKPLDGLSAIDYGTVTTQTGLQLMQAVQPNWFMSFIFMIGVIAAVRGTVAQTVGAENNEMFEEVSDLTESGIASIGMNQGDIQDVTNVEGIALAAPEDSEESDEAVADAESADKTTGEAAASPEDTLENVEAPENTATAAPESSESASESEGSQNDDKDADINELIANQGANEAKASDATNESNEYNEEAKSDSEESQKIEKDAKKDEKQLTREGKNLLKLIDQDQKEVEEITKESEAAVQEQEMLVSEFEGLQVQVENAQSQQPAAQPAQNQEQGGLLAPAPAAQPQQDNGTQATQDRMVTISARFTELGNRINKNSLRLTKIQGSINTRVKKYQKVTKERIKIQKAYQKQEEAKQKKMQKTLAALDIVSNVFSIIGAIASLMQICGVTHITIGSILIATGTPLLSNPFTAAAGASLVAAGTAEEATGGTSEAGGISIAGYCTIGVACCQVAKAGVLLANGYSAQALMTLGTAIISIATSAIGGGAAAGNVLQGISNGLSIVSSSAQLAANVQTVQGKEQSEWLNVTSQVAGAASALTSVAGGLQGAFSADSTASVFSKVTQVVGATGTALSTGSQMATMISGEETKAGNVIAMVGAGMQTAAAAASLVGSATGLNDNSKTRQENKVKAEAQKQAKKEMKAEKAEQKQAKADAKAEQKAQKAAEKASESKQKEQTAEKGQEVKETIESNTPQSSSDIKTAVENAQQVTTSDTKEIGVKAQEIASTETAQEIQSYTPESSETATVNVAETEVVAAKIDQPVDVVADAQAAASQLGDIEGVSASEIAENPTHVEAQLDAKISQMEADSNGIVRREEAPLISPDRKAEIDAELNKAPELKIKEGDIKTPDLTEYNNAKKAEVLKGIRSQQRQENMEKATGIIGKVGEGFSAAMQVTQTVAKLGSDDDAKAKQQKNVLQLSNMKKGKALIKKVKQRRQASKMSNKYYA